MSVNIKTSESFIRDSVIKISSEVTEFVDWTKFDRAGRDCYVRAVDDALIGIDLCNNPLCEENHCHQIDVAYNSFVNSMKACTSSFKIKTSKKIQPVPGWNDHCKDLNRNAHCHVLSWLSTGKCRYGPEFEGMKGSRKLFVYALKFCKRNENKIRDSNLVRKFNCGKGAEFWKEVKKRRNVNGNSSICESDGLKDPAAIAESFKNKLSSS